VEKARATEDGDFVIRVAKAVMAVPGLCTVIVALYKLLDRYGLAPSVLVRGLPFYSGMFITNNASIGLNHVMHHIYNFGNVGLFIAMGNILKEAALDGEGNVRMKRWLPLGLTADERICSGAHYSAFFSDVTKFMGNPELLEIPPETVLFDEKVEYHVPKVGQA